MKGKKERRRIPTIFLVVMMVASVLALSMPALAEDNDLNTVPPPPPENVEKVQSPTSESIVDHGDGTYTFTQQVDEASSPPHYSGPWDGSYGFEYYSWYDQDYGWMHTFSEYTQPSLLIASATLTIRAWDVDSEVSHGWDGEYDGVTGDGNWLDPQYLQGQNNQWSVTTFNVDPSSLLDGQLDVWLDIDMHHTEDWWATTLDYSILTVDYTFTANNPPYAPELSISPVGCTYTTDDLVVTVTGPTPPDPDGDSVTYEYRWLVDTGTGFFVDDEFAGRGDHTGSTVPSLDTVNDDIWRVQVTPVDEHGAHGTSNTVTFAQIGQCFTPPIADAGGDQTSCTTSATLDGSGSYDPDGTIVSYLWELHSAGAWTTIGTSEIITYDFGGEGTYQVRLTVTDNDGLTDPARAYITVDYSICPPAYLCPDEYRWNTAVSPTGYEWDPFPALFRSWNDVHFVNSGPGDAFGVTASISYAPANVNIVDGDVTLGDIPAGGSAWSSDFFELEVDMTNPQDPNEGIKWTVEYDDAAGTHHVIVDVPEFCLPE